MTSRPRSCSSLLTLSLTGLVALTITACGTTRLTAQGLSSSRGAVAMSGPSSKAIVTGPVAIHVYSEFPGGTIYNAPVVNGTDGDCNPASAGGSAAATAIPADEVTVYDVPQGRVACIATETRGTFELLWHSMAASAQSVPTSLQAKN